MQTHISPLLTLVGLLCATPVTLASPIEGDDDDSADPEIAIPGGGGR